MGPKRRRNTNEEKKEKDHGRTHEKVETAGWMGKGTYREKTQRNEKGLNCMKEKETFREESCSYLWGLIIHLAEVIRRQAFALITYIR